MVAAEVIRESVERGAALLDIKCPDWADKVNVNRLNILSHMNCVLGQIFGSYTVGSSVLFGDECLLAGHEFHHGFAVFSSCSGYYFDIFSVNDTMIVFWKEEIEKRLVDSEFNNIVERNKEDMKWDPTVYSVPYWGGQFPGSDIDTDTNGVVPTYDYQNPELFVSFSQGNNAPAQPKGINTYQLVDESKFTKNGSPPTIPIPV